MNPVVEIAASISAFVMFWMWVSYVAQSWHLLLRGQIGYSLECLVVGTLAFVMGFLVTFTTFFEIPGV